MAVVCVMCYLFSIVSTAKSGFVQFSAIDHMSRIFNIVRADLSCRGCGSFGTLRMLTYAVHVLNSLRFTSIFVCKAYFYIYVKHQTSFFHAQLKSLFNIIRTIEMILANLYRFTTIHILLGTLIN